MVIGFSGSHPKDVEIWTHVLVLMIKAIEQTDNFLHVRTFIGISWVFYGCDLNERFVTFTSILGYT